MAKIRNSLSKKSTQKKNIGPKVVKKPKKVQQPSLLQLPAEIHELILANLSPWNGRRFRATCRHSKELYDNFIQHKFNTKLADTCKTLPTSLESFTMLNTFQTAARTGRRMGVFPVFLDKLLNQTNFLRIDQIKGLLMRYFSTVDNYQKRVWQRTRRFLHLLTLIDLITAIKGPIKLRWQIKANSTKQSIQFIIPEVWLVAFRDRRGLGFNFLTDKNCLFVILSEIVYHSNINRSFR